MEKGILHPASKVCDSLFPLAVPKISIGKFTLFLARLVERQTFLLSFAVYERIFPHIFSSFSSEKPRITDIGQFDLISEEAEI